MICRRLCLTLLAAVLVHPPLFAHENDKAPDRSPQNLGKVLVFSGTGWYRHPETPAING